MTLNYQPIKHGEFPTPPDFYHKLDSEFHFTLDPCATVENAKCQKFFTKADNGLAQDWGKEIVFMNPPYNTVKDWIKKAYYSSLRGATVVCLIPSRTDTSWWHDYCMKGEIRFIRGRLKFCGKDSAPFPSAVIIFRRFL